jgi:VanZ family protein
MKKLCIAYWLLLSLLLLSRNPLAWLRGSDSLSAASQLVEPAAHFVCFLVLAIVAWLAAWPISRSWLPLVLSGYALATELLQRLVPGRTPDLADFYQDLAGIALGCTVCWLIQFLAASPRPAVERPATWRIPRRRTEP